MMDSHLSPIPPSLRNGIWMITLYCYAVVYLGAYVRHTNSGLGCTTWPTCNGEWIPDLTGAVGIQFIHRVAAFLFLLMIIGLTIFVQRHYRHRKDLFYGSWLALIFTLLQILSGGFVVLTGIELFPALLHNSIISVLFGVLCYLCWQTIEQPKSVSSSKRRTYIG